MKEILEKISGCITQLNEYCYNKAFIPKKATSMKIIDVCTDLTAIKTELEKYDKLHTFDVSNYHYVNGKWSNTLTIPKPPKLTLKKRIELLKQSKEKPTTGGYNESELRSLDCDVFVIKDKDVIRENFKLIIDKQTGSFVVILKCNEYYVPLALEDIFKEHIGENIINFNRLPTRREKAIFEAFYPEYRTEPENSQTESEKLEMPKIDVGWFMYNKISREVVEITEMNYRCNVIRVVNNTKELSYTFDRFSGSHRLATETEIQDYVNRPIDVSSLKVGDLLYKLFGFYAKQICKIVVINKNDFIKIDKTDFKYELVNAAIENGINQYFRYPTQKEINEYLAEQKPKQSEPKKEIKVYDLKDYEITVGNLELYKGLYLYLTALGGMVVKLVKIKDNNLWLKPAHLTKKESITILTKDIFNCCRYATESELKAYKERKQAKKSVKLNKQIMESL